MKKQLLALTAVTGMMLSGASVASMSSDYWLGAGDFGDFSDFVVLATDPALSGSPDYLASKAWYVDVDSSGDFNSGDYTGTTTVSNTGNNALVTGSVQKTDEAFTGWYGVVTGGAFDMSNLTSLNTEVLNSGVNGAGVTFSIFIDFDTTVDGDEYYGADLFLAESETGNATFDLTSLNLAPGQNLNSVASYGVRIAGDTNNIHVTMVPEPSTVLLLGAGLMGLGFAARRKSKKSA